MKRETITQVVLTADPGMYLTNGEVYGRTVVLPADASQEEWQELPEEAYLEHLKEQDSQADS
jgi:hypothetical protein